MALQDMLEPSINALGFELVGLEYLNQGHHSLLRIYIDSEQGIQVEDCAMVSRQVSALMDVEDPIRGEYTLEVSSPGVDRPLFKAEHYERFVGSLVDIRLRVANELGRRKFKGRIQAVEVDRVLVEVDGETVTFALDNIEKANLVPEW